jgi:hypothetical protein
MAVGTTGITDARGEKSAAPDRRGKVVWWSRFELAVLREEKPGWGGLQ